MSDVKDYRAGLVPDILALLPLRGTVLLPHAVLPLGAAVEIDAIIAVRPV